MNELATKFLEIYAAGGEPEGGWTFGKALQQARLDFTADSLKRLDALLGQIRDRAKPTRADLDTVPGRNFESLLAFYVIEFARRITHTTFTWHDRASALAAIPRGATLEDAPDTRLVVDAPAQGVLFKPLTWLEGQLLPGGVAVRAGDYIASVKAQLECDGPSLWWTAMHAVGRLGSWQMLQAFRGYGVWPTLVTAAAPAMLQRMDGNDLGLAVRYGDHLLSNNPDDLPWQVFSYPGYAERNGQRVDAVVVLVATYNDKPMRMRVAFPFRPARDGNGFVIWRPLLVEGNLSVEDSGKLAAALERGILGEKWSGETTWNDLYQP